MIDISVFVRDKWSLTIIAGFIAIQCFYAAEI